MEIYEVLHRKDEQEMILYLDYLDMMIEMLQKRGKRDLILEQEKALIEDYLNSQVQEVLHYD